MLKLLSYALVKTFFQEIMGKHNLKFDIIFLSSAIFSISFYFSLLSNYLSVADFEKKFTKPTVSKFENLTKLHNLVRSQAVFSKIVEQFK